MNSSQSKLSNTPSEPKNGGGTSLSGETPKGTPTTLAAKLLNIQKTVEAVTKDSRASVGKFSYNYADINTYIEVVKPVLNDAGVVLLQPLTHIDGVPAIQTILMDGVTGDKMEFTTPIPQNPDPQKQGAIITYFRRYALQAALLLQAEDTDAADTKPLEDVPFI